MCLGGNTWFKWLIFVVFISFYSHFALSSEGTYWRINAWYNEDAKGYNSGGYDFSKCDGSLFPFNVEYGDSSAPRDDMVQDSAEDYIMITYGKRWEKNKKSGIYKYSRGVKFKAPQQYRQPIVSALKRALAQGNCIAAADLADGLANGQECFGDAYCFENTNDDGTKNQCYVKSDGENKCKISDGKTEETLPDGTPKINIDCPADQDCRRETDLNGYADQTDKASPKAESGGKRELRGKEGDKGSNGGSSGGSSGGSGSGSNLGGSSGGSGKGSGGGSNLGGSLGGSSGGSDDDSDNKGDGGDQSGKDGKGKGEKGKGEGKGKGKGNGGGGLGNGDGSGNGSGDGKGVEFPELAEFDIKQAITEAKESLQNKLSLDGISLSGGSCPTFTVSVFGASESIDLHCKIFDANGGAITAAFLFIWGFAAVRIFLSA